MISDTIDRLSTKAAYLKQLSLAAKKKPDEFNCIENHSLPMMLFDDDYVIVYTNQAMKSLIGGLSNCQRIQDALRPKLMNGYTNGSHVTIIDSNNNNQVVRLYCSKLLHGSMLGVLVPDC